MHIQAGSEIQPWERDLIASSLHALDDDPLSAAQLA